MLVSNERTTRFFSAREGHASIAGRGGVLRATDKAPMPTPISRKRRRGLRRRLDRLSDHRVVIERNPKKFRLFCTSFQRDTGISLQCERLAFPYMLNAFASTYKPCDQLHREEIREMKLIISV